MIQLVTTIMCSSARPCDVAECLYVSSARDPSYSGGHVLVLGAIDRRVKCVVSQVPLISGHALARRLVRSDFLAGLHRMFEDDRRARYGGKPPAMIPVVSENPAGPAALPTPDSWTFFTETARKRAPAWKNEVTLRSVEMFTEYEPGSYIAHISPTPPMLVVCLRDHLTVADHALGLTSGPSRRRNWSP